MPITDLANNPIDPSAVSFLGFATSEAPVFPHDIYSYLIHSVRELDQRDGEELILRWLAAAQSEFEDTYERILSILTFPDPENCPAEALQYLKWIVGLTAKLAELTENLAEADLRRLISIAARMWKLKGTEKGLANTLRAITTYEVRVLNWFFFRIIVGEAELGREELNVDPWLLDVPGMSPAVLPDAVESRRVAKMTVLPSADDPAWTYVDEGEAVEGNVFNLSAGELEHAQTTAAGGRYVQNYPPGFLVDSAQLGVVWSPVTLTAVGGRPWHLSLKDGIRTVVLAWSDTEVALEDEAGNVVVGPLSRGFVAGTSYRMRLSKAGTSAVIASVDGVDLFGEVDTSAFPATAISQYGFGYRNLGQAQNWTVHWDDAGPLPLLTFDLTTLLGATEAVPHRIRCRYLPKKADRTVWSYWDGSTNRCHVDDGFGQDAPVAVTGVNDFLVGVDPDEFVSDVRLVDDGTGLLDRNLVEGLVAILRPAGERYFVRYLDFSDTFGGTFTWTEVSGTVVPYPDEGYVTLEDGIQDTVIKTDAPGDTTWSEPQVAVQFSLRDLVAGRWVEVRFLYQDELNHYAVRVDPGTRVVSLRKVTAGVPSTLHAAPPRDAWWPDVNYMIHVQTETVVGGTLIRYLLDGNLLGEATDPDHTQGKLAVGCSISQRLRLTFAELYQAPLESARLGPP